jgi:outer membrane protein OmpA-like peptidoglycan-associated protein
VLRFVFFITLLIPLGSASAALQRYVASEHESRWVTSSSRLYCSLTHEIPLYGKAMFQSSAGGELGMSVEVMRKPHKTGLARLISTAPSWKHETRERDLGQVAYKVDRTAFTLNHIPSRRVLSELEQGMFPTFTYQDWSDGRDEVKVSLSAVNIRHSLGEFLDCLSMLLPYSYNYVRESKLYFPFASSALGEKEKQRLDELAEYLLADGSISEVVLYGRTDSRGYRAYNDALGRRRAESVRDYLTDKGVSRDKFTIKVVSFGERRPVATNRTAKGRSLNRVVEVTLLK